MASKRPTPESQPPHSPEKTTLPDTMQASASTDSSVEDAPGPTANSGSPKNSRFWAIIFALCITSLLAAVESSVVVTSLPTIIEDLGVGQNYIWVANIFFLTKYGYLVLLIPHILAAVQPLLGQLSNLFGRRHLTLFIVAVYLLGSGICGGATTPAMLIAGRVVQGVGSGGVNLCVDVIIADLVPLRQRGNFIAIILAIYGVGMALGPFIGGIIVQTTTWRWVFYLNLPIGAVALALLWAFLRVRWNREERVWAKLRRVDLLGNGILVASTVSVLVALTWANVVYPWSSPRVLAPLIAGLAGLVAFLFYEGRSSIPEPVMPLRLFSNRTSLIVYITTFLNYALVYWAFFFVPLYFQAVRLDTPAKSGVDLLVFCLVGIPGASIAVLVLARWGRYRWLHVTGSALFTLGFGLFSLLDQDTSTAAWVWICIVPALGSGMLLNTLLPAFQASLAEADQAAATASWNFIRSLGNVWGVAIPASIYNAYVSRYAAELVRDAGARAALSTGGSYASATRAFVLSFEESVQHEVIEAIRLALQKVFLIAIAFGGLSTILALFEQDVKLRTELETEFGLEEREAKAPVPANSTTNTYTCDVADASYCVDTSLGGNIIIRCNGLVGTAGNCDDNVSGEPPLGGVAECWQTSDTSGDAACAKNCIVYAASGSFTLPDCTPIGGTSSSSSSSYSAVSTTTTTTTTSASSGAVYSTTPLSSSSSSTVYSNSTTTATSGSGSGSGSYSTGQPVSTVSTTTTVGGGSGGSASGTASSSATGGSVSTSAGSAHYASRVLAILLGVAAYLL
ncbi:major facilitator superfamily domain-containing protein [Xylariales sp. PMI_506]|nr:major facilitator superfamily domain-containing protein [Xylariales sp. PMI_506]